MTKLFKGHDCDTKSVEDYWKKTGQDVKITVLKDIKKQNDECYVLIENAYNFSDFRKAIYDLRLAMIEVK